MLSIAVYDSEVFVETHPDYPKSRIHTFSTVWNFDEDGNFEKLKNVSMNAKNKRLTKDFELQKGKIYLIKSSKIEKNKFLFPSILSKSEIIEFVKTPNNEQSHFRIYVPGNCKNLSLDLDYAANETLINNFLKAEFNHHNICDFTKYMLITVSKKNAIGLENKIYALAKFDRDSYFKKQLSKSFKKPAKKALKKEEIVEVAQVSLDFDTPKKDKNLFEEAVSIRELNEFLDSDTSRESGETKEMATPSMFQDEVVAEEVVVAKKEETPKSEPKVETSKFGNRFTQEQVDFAVESRHLLNKFEIGEKIGRKAKSVEDKIRFLIEGGKISNRGFVLHYKNPISDNRKEALAKELKYFRKEKGLSQVSVAEIIDINDSTISYFENKKKGISDSMYQKIKYLIKNFDEMGDVIDGKIAKKITSAPKAEPAKEVEVVAPELKTPEPKVEKAKVVAPEIEPVEEIEQYVEDGYLKGGWTEEEVAFLKKNYPTKGRKFCSNNLNRNESSVQKKINNLGLKKKPTNKSKRKSEPVNKELVEANRMLIEANKILSEANENLKKGKKSFWKRIFGGQ